GACPARAPVRVPARGPVPAQPARTGTWGAMSRRACSIAALASEQLTQTRGHVFLEARPTWRVDQRLVDLQFDPQIAGLCVLLSQPRREAVGVAAIRIVAAHAQLRVELLQQLGPAAAQRRFVAPTAVVE